MKRPAFQFYPADWRKDAAVQSCGMAARGLWHEMLCIMHECQPYGHLTVNGQPMTPAQLARLVGESVKDVQAWLSEIEAAGVFSRTPEGCIFSRRMVKDEQIRTVRAEAGRLGGNPNLVNQKDNQKVKQAVNQDANQHNNHPPNQSGNQSPTPSSSSSSSPSGNSEANASGAVAPKDPAEIIFHYGVGILTASGSADKDARAFLGKLRKHYPDEQIVDVLRACVRAKPLQPLTWLAAALPPPALMNKTLTKTGQQAKEAAEAWLGEAA